MRCHARYLLAAAGFCASAAFADTPYSFDVSDLWWNPSESGWGLNLAQQDDTVFATMFVYGPDGRPHWFSASSMRGQNPGQNMTFSGRLVESTGPIDPLHFDPAGVSRRDVGAIAIQMHGDNSADLVYSVDGVEVRKQVQRLTMKSTNATGEYNGYVARSGCNAENTTGSIRILQSPSSFSMTTTTHQTSVCTYTGTPQQRGRILDVQGTFSCNFGWTGNFELSNTNVTYQGFLGHLTQSGMGCSSEARVGGVSNEGNVAARATADISDLWWNPDESGWGINFQQQDDLAFATLFTYGFNREEKWYSASDMHVGFVLGGGLPSFDGNLYESTGPSYLTAFNPSAVTRRLVGEIHFTPMPGVPDEANLMYYVDGVQYLKHLKRLTTKGNNASGSYKGTYAMRNTCSGGGSGTFNDPVTFSITQVNGALSMTATTANQTCTYGGSYEQRGRMLFSQGSYNCGGNLPESGNYRISELEAGEEGVIGQIQRGAGNPDTFFAGGCMLTGRIMGVRPY